MGELSSAHHRIRLFDVVSVFVVFLLHISCISATDCAHKTPAECLEIDGPFYWRYIEEQSADFQVLERDESLDERLSKVVYNVQRSRLISYNIFQTNQGNDALNELAEARAAGKLVDDELCGRHLNAMLSLMQDTERIVQDRRNASLRNARKLNETHIRLARVLDSFGHYEAGVMNGRQAFVGDHDQCQSTRLVFDDDEQRTKTTTTRMRYCVARLASDRYLDEAHREYAPRVYQVDNSLHVAVCLPISCHMRNYRGFKTQLQKLIDSQFHMPKALYVHDTLELRSLYCQADADSEYAQMPLAGRAFLTLALGWIGLLFVATLCNARDSSLVLGPFNVRSNWRDFTHVRVANNGAPSRVNLDTMNPMKVFCSMVVIAGHVFVLKLGACSDLLRAYNRCQNSGFAMLLISSTIVTDSFFVITGMLVAASTLNVLRRIAQPAKVDSNNNNNQSSDALLKHEFGSAKEFVKFWLLVVASRALRLVPLFYTMFWYVKSVHNYLAPQPFWDQGFNRETLAGACRHESWLTPITLKGTYMPVTQQCMPHAWSVSADMFATAVIVPMVMLVPTRPKLAHSLLLLAAVSSVVRMWFESSTGHPVLMQQLDQIRVFAAAILFRWRSVVYTAAHNRVFSVAIGAIGGCALHRYEHTATYKWPRWLSGPCTWLATGLVVAQFAGPCFVPYLRKSGALQEHTERTHLAEYNMVTSRALWSVASVVLLLRMCTDCKDTHAMRWCAGRLGKIAARVTYSIFIIHMYVVFSDAQSQSTSPAFSFYALVYTSTYITVWCIALGTLVHLCVETPMNKLIKRHIQPLLIGARKHE